MRLYRVYCGENFWNCVTESDAELVSEMFSHKDVTKVEEVEIKEVDVPPEQEGQSV